MNHKHVTFDNAYNAASAWYAGQTSAMYSFLSTGIVHGQEHAANILVEIHDCQSMNTEYDAEDNSELARFQAFILGVIATKFFNKSLEEMTEDDAKVIALQGSIALNKINIRLA